MGSSGESGKHYVVQYLSDQSGQWCTSLAGSFATREEATQVAEARQLSHGLQYRVVEDLGNYRPKPDDVTKPAHYTRLVPEPIEVLESWGVDWHTGNIIKYLVRAGHKPGADVVTDLKKAEQYLKRLIALKEKQK